VAPKQLMNEIKRAINFLCVSFRHSTHEQISQPFNHINLVREQQKL